MKTYAAKSSVKRAIVKSLGKEEFEKGSVVQVGDKWGFEPAPVVVKEEKPTETKTVTVRTQKDLTPERRASNAVNPCQLVWAIAEEMLAQGAKRKDIIAECEKQGVAFYTARTQYQKYTAAVKEAAASPVAELKTA